MKKRQKEIEQKYEEQWDGGKGSHHPDYDPEAVRASRLSCMRAGWESVASLVSVECLWAAVYCIQLVCRMIAAPRWRCPAPLLVHKLVPCCCSSSGCAARRRCDQGVP